MTKTIEEPLEKKEKPKFFDLSEDDSPEIGIATKEPLPEYFAGVKTEFKKIEWPTREQVTQEFLAVMVIVAIISALIFSIDIGLDKFMNFISGGRF